MIAAVVLITFHPNLGTGFFAEDHTTIDRAARSAWSQQLAYYFDFSASASFYRPLQGIQFWLEYRLFGNNVMGYRLEQLLFHLANSFLLYALVTHVSKKWWVGLVATLMYAGIPTISTSFFWISNLDRFLAFFYLLSLSFWLKYLEKKDAGYDPDQSPDSKVHTLIGFDVTKPASRINRSTPSHSSYLLAVYTSALIFFVLALLTKEIAATLPLTLFLADRWLVRGKAHIRGLLYRYLPFVLILAGYGLYYIRRIFLFTSNEYGGPYAGVGVGTNLLTNMRYYTMTLVFPWAADDVLSLLGLAIVIALLLYLVFVRQSRSVAFLSAMAILPILPVLPLPLPAGRYLYLPMMASMTLLAALLERGRRALATWEGTPFLYAAGIGLVVLGNAASDVETFGGIAGFIRQTRLPMRPIFQQHSSFSDDSYLYFINSPIEVENVAGMFTLQYGTDVIVGGTDFARPADLRKHKSAYVYYFDETTGTREQKVAQETSLSSVPKLPVTFDNLIRLEGYEIADQRLQRGQSLVLLLYWKALAKTDRDWTVFAHLVDANGEMIAGADGPPRAGKSPTSGWRTNALVVDWVVIPITDDIGTANDYRLQIGWYYLPTMERIQVRDEHGQPVTDSLVLQPIEIVK